MKQIGFIILAGISGLFAAHHLNKAHYSTGIVCNENKKSEHQKQSASVVLHHVKMKGHSTTGLPDNLVVYTSPKQLEASDQIINSQMSDEMAVAGLSFIPADQVRESDQVIGDQFESSYTVHYDQRPETVSDMVINDQFRSENQLMAHTR